VYLLLQCQLDVEGDGGAGVDVKYVQHPGVGGAPVRRQGQRTKLRPDAVTGLPIARPGPRQRCPEASTVPSQLDRGRTPRSQSLARTAPLRLCRIDQRDPRRRSRDEALR